MAENLKGAEEQAKNKLNELTQETQRMIEEKKEFQKSIAGSREAFNQVNDAIRQLRSPVLQSIASYIANTAKQRQQTELLEQSNKIAQLNLEQGRQRTEILRAEKERLEESKRGLVEHRAQLEREISELGKLSDIRQQQVALKQQEVEGLKSSISASATEAIKKKEALDVQTGLIKSKIAELQESRKNKDSGKSSADIKKEIKELRQQEASLVSEYAGLEEEVRQSSVAQKLLTEKESELGILQQKLQDVNEQHLDAIQRVTDEEDGYKTALSNLNKGILDKAQSIQKSKEAESKLEEAAKKAAKDLAMQSYKAAAEKFRDLANIANRVSTTLFSFVDTVRKTQNALGISSVNAVDVIMGNFGRSVQSFFTSATTVTGKEILGAQEAFRAEFGGVITSGAAKDLAIQAKELGVTTEQLAQARRVFMTTSMGNVGEAKAQTDRFIAEFQKRGLTSKDAMEAITKNSELFARNGNRFAQSFVRAAAEAKKIGVDLGKIDQVGDNIIGDFEGFLMKMSELGAMGFGLDSGRLAEVAETGDTGALFDELRSQLAATGKDITNLRRSEQLALSQAFGIPMAELQRLAAPTAGSGEQLTEQEQTNSLLTIIADKMGYVATAIGGLFTLAGGYQTYLLSKIATSTGISAAKSGATEATGAIKSAAGAAGGAAPTAGGAGGGVSGISKLTSGLNPAALLQGAAALVVMAGALYVMGKALQQFKDVSAGDLGVAVGAITALTLALVALGALMASGIGAVAVLAGVGALVLMAGAVALIGASLQAVGNSADGIARLGTSFDTLASALGRLNALDFGKLDKIKELANTNLALQPITAPTVPTVPPATPKAPPATGAAPVTPATPATPVTPVDFAPLEKKLDAVVAAIGRMSVQLDGNKVGRVVANTAASTAQVGVLARSS